MTPGQQFILGLVQVAAWPVAVLFSVLFIAEAIGKQRED